MSHIDLILLPFSGLSFFVMGLIVAFRAATSLVPHIRRRFSGLAAFGLIYGASEWLIHFDLFDPAHFSPEELLAVVALSFLALYWFALEVLVRRHQIMFVMVFGLGAMWCVSAWVIPNPAALEILTHFAIGAPASFIAAYAYVWDKSFRAEGEPIKRATIVGGLGFAVLGLLQVFSGLAELFPSLLFNPTNFETVFGLTYLVTRALTAFFISTATITLIGFFAYTQRQEIEEESARLHEALVASEASLANAQRIGNMGSWEWNIAADELFWSDQIFRIYDMEPQEFGNTYEAFLERVYPSDRSHVEESVEQAINDHTRYDVKHRIILPTGEVRIVHKLGEVEYSAAGQPLRMTGTVQDITEQQEAEDELRKGRVMLSGILNIAEEAIILADNSLRIIQFSRGAQRLFGYEGDEAIGKFIEQLIPERYRATHSGKVRKFSEGPHNSIQMDSRIEFVGLRKNGEEFPAAISLSKLQIGKRYLYSLILRDIGPEKAAHDELLTAKLVAEAANHAKSSFLANMSHELRTPLNAIIGFSETISRQTYGPVGSSKYLEYIDDINQSGMHLLKIINDILDLSKIEAGEADLDEEVIEVSEAVRSCLNLVKRRAKTGGVDLKCDVLTGAAPLYADELKLRQILINLLSNAIKFTPAGGEVVIKTWSRPEAGYVFQIADTGIGIALEDIPAVLTPFKQVDSDLNRKFEGTGLGLALTKSLVEMHSGSLDLQSEVGVGTTVTVRLPAERIVLKTATAR